jgi:phage terminase small subunit
MGLRGPVSAGRDRLLRHGNHKGKYQPAKALGDFDGQVVQPPEDLDAIASEVFASVQQKLVAMGLWDSSFQYALSRYGQCWSRWTKIIHDPVALACDWVKIDSILRQLESRFGLTPADRQRLPKGQPEEPEDTNRMRFFHQTDPKRIS